MLTVPHMHVIVLSEHEGTKGKAKAIEKILDM